MHELIIIVIVIILIFVILSNRKEKYYYGIPIPLHMCIETCKKVNPHMDNKKCSIKCLEKLISTY
jgi:hypothetical protein